LLYSPPTRVVPRAAPRQRARSSSFARSTRQPGRKHHRRFLPTLRMVRGRPRSIAQQRQACCRWGACYDVALPHPEDLITTRISVHPKCGMECGTHDREARDSRLHLTAFFGPEGCRPSLSSSSPPLRIVYSRAIRSRPLYFAMPPRICGALDMALQRTLASLLFERECDIARSGSGALFGPEGYRPPLELSHFVPFTVLYSTSSPEQASPVQARSSTAPEMTTEACAEHSSTK
jgi:hypothetical protein